MLTSPQAGYCGSHLPTVSSIESSPFGLELQDHRGGKGLRGAAHGEEGVLVDRRIVGAAAGPAGERLDVRARGGEADIGGDARHPLDRGALGQPAVERRLHALNLRWRVVSHGGARKKQGPGRKAANGKSHDLSPPH